MRAHSLNRVGIDAAKLNHDVLTFFGNIESFYSLFSSSPGRWELLKQHEPLSLQSLSEARWSERLQTVLTVSTAERCFSRMPSSLKTRRRSTTNQNCMNHLAIVGIENELAKGVDFSDVIDHFSQKKTTKHGPIIGTAAIKHGRANNFFLSLKKKYEKNYENKGPASNSGSRHAISYVAMRASRLSRVLCCHDRNCSLGHILKKKKGSRWKGTANQRRAKQETLVINCLERQFRMFKLKLNLGKRRRVCAAICTRMNNKLRDMKANCSGATWGQRLYIGNHDKPKLACHCSAVCRVKHYATPGHNTVEEYTLLVEVDPTQGFQTLYISVVEMLTEAEYDPSSIRSGWERNLVAAAVSEQCDCNGVQRHNGAVITSTRLAIMSSPVYATPCIARADGRADRCRSTARRPCERDPLLINREGRFAPAGVWGVAIGGEGERSRLFIPENLPSHAIANQAQDPFTEPRPANQRMRTPISKETPIRLASVYLYTLRPCVLSYTGVVCSLWWYTRLCCAQADGGRSSTTELGSLSHRLSPHSRQRSAPHCGRGPLGAGATTVDDDSSGARLSLRDRKLPLVDAILLRWQRKSPTANTEPEFRLALVLAHWRGVVQAPASRRYFYPCSGMGWREVRTDHSEQSRAFLQRGQSVRREKEKTSRISIEIQICGATFRPDANPRPRHMIRPAGHTLRVGRKAVQCWDTEMVVRSQRDWSTSSLVYGYNTWAQFELTVNGKFEVIQNGKFEVILNGKFELTVNGKFEVIQNGKFELTNGKFEVILNGKFELTVNGKFEVIQNGKFELTVNGSLKGLEPYAGVKSYNVSLRYLELVYDVWSRSQQARLLCRHVSKVYVIRADALLSGDSFASFKDTSTKYGEHVLCPGVTRSSTVVLAGGRISAMPHPNASVVLDSPKLACDLAAPNARPDLRARMQRDNSARRDYFHAVILHDT
ncbi:hypothetical protein PR048_004025 [Dryococelus australis]|uniref:Uncharacterized protein n=1 Tax=Dryococelus australis TaxID=614101 RepID=A0ABQ9I4B5_9NEOP|nr:hypothetical protein PR048_004025 [Dryococelus australis]